MSANRDELQRNVEAVKRLQQFIETISATFRLMSADLDRLLQDLSPAAPGAGADRTGTATGVVAQWPAASVALQNRER